MIQEEEKSLNLNLLPNQAKFQAAKLKLQARLKGYMKLMLTWWIVAIVLVAVAYFGSDFVLGVENKKLEKSVEAYKSMSEEVILGQVLKYRAKVLGEVLKNRFEYSAAIEKVSSLFQGEATVANFELKEKNMFGVIVEANSRAAEELVESKVAEINKGGVEGVESAVISSAEFNRTDGVWLIKMEVKIK